jgi:hypothetical protein
LHAIQHIHGTEGGIVGLYRGMWPTAMGIIPYGGINFMSYEYFKRLWEQHYGQGEDALPTHVRLLSGGFAGALGQTASYPLDVVRRRMQLSSFVHFRDNFSRHDYSTTYSSLRSIIIYDGYMGLFRGISINYIKVVPMVSISFTVYDTLLKYAGVFEQTGD